MLLEQTYSFLLLSLLLVDDLPQLLRRKRHINMRHAERISNSIRDRARSSDRTSLTDTFHTKRIDGSQRDGVIKLIAGKFRSNWQRIVRQCSRQKLAILPVHDPFNHRLSNALSNATMNLTLNDHGVELTPTVVNCHVACNLRHASLLVYLDNANMRAEGEGKGFWLPEDRCLQARLDTCWQRIRSIGHCGYLVKGDRFLGRTGH